jgi:xanthine dehydrogenase molybdenum-binding subunit
MGQGLHSALTLGLAESLGVKPEQIFINETDTATCPWDVGTHASRGAFMACKAGILAAEKARHEIFGLAEELFPKIVAKSLAKFRKRNPDYEPPAFDVAAAAKRERFDLCDGVVFLKDAPDEPWLKVDLGQLIRASHFRAQGKMLTVESFYDPPNELPDFEKGVGNLSATYAYGTQGAEVEVDTETGEIKVLKMVAAHDVGKTLNPQTLKGQLYGGLAQGIGYALTEELLTKDGRILNPGFTDYKMPTVHEMAFPIQLEIVETDDQEGPFGAKGVGEPGLVPTAPAIANAVYDAVGIRLHHLPMTPEKVLEALQAKHGSAATT